MKNETDLKECIRMLISEELVRFKSISGTEWEGDKSRIRTVMATAGISHYRVADILGGVKPIEQKELAVLKAKNLVVQVRPKKERVAKPKQTSANGAQSKLDKAVKAFASNWSDFESENPGEGEGAASDAAEGFFHDYPEWSEWAQALELSQQDVKSMVTDWVYQAMSTGKI